MMKKTKALSLTLAILMLLTLIPMFALPASAVDAGDTSTMPGVLPNGDPVSKTKVLAEWDTVGSETTASAAVENGFFTIKKVSSFSWTKQWISSTAWRGASGFMFYVDASGVTNEQAGFIFKILTNATRTKDGSAGGCIQFTTAPGALSGGAATHTYLYKDGKWRDISTTAYNLEAGTNASGWYYLPFTSFLNLGASAAKYAGDPTIGYDFQKFMENFEDQRLGKIGIESKYVGLKFGDVHFVYASPEVEDGATANLFGNVALNSTEGEAAGNIADNSVTVSKMTGNSATASGNRVWLKGLAQTSLSGATGLRFHVDTTKLDDGAKLQLRLRIMTTTGPNTGATDVWGAGATAAGYASFTTGSYMQYVCRSDGSVAYYFDESGNAKALYPNTNVASSGEADLFDALPENYNGDIYIPLDSFWLSTSWGSYGSVWGSRPFDLTADKYSIGAVAICHAISGTTTNTEVTYSDFELVYADTKIDSQSVTINDSFDINYYAALQEGASTPKMTFTMDGKKVEATGSKQENGLYKFTYSGILPQQIGDTLTAEYSATVGKATVKQTTTYSVKQYCENMLKTSADAKLNTLLVDILYYGDAAQKYANYKTDSLATAGLTDEQKALRSANTTADITATAKIAGTADGAHSWKGANLYLNSRLSMELTFRADSIERLKIKVNGTEYTPEEKSTGVYKVRIDNISITSGDVTANFVKDGTDTGETLTYSIDAYIKKALATDASANATELLVSLYGYRTSALAYAGASN